MPHTWSDEDRQAVADHLREGLSASQIAEALPFDITRNAIVGIVHRDGLLKRLGFVRPAHGPKRPKSKKPDPPQEKKPVGGKAEKSGSFPVSALPDYDPADDGIKSYYAAIAAKKARGDTHDWEDRPKAKPLGVPLSEIRDGQCRWPLWEDQGGPAFLLCGAATALDQHYCEGHRARAARKVA